MPEPYGAFALVLHSHLPYVLAHDRLEEEWLFEAVVESYLPLFHAFERLRRQGISPQVTLGITPVLLEQLADPRFGQQFLSYLEQRVEVAQHDRRAFQQRKEEHLARLASLWEESYRRSMAFFTDELSGDLIGALRRLQKHGHIEILTSAATHAYLPLLGLDESVRAQIEIGVDCYRRHFRQQPQGFWLPECAYRPAGHWIPPLAEVEGLHSTDRQAVDQFLASSGLRYFIVDAAQLRRSPPDPARHSPLRLYWVDGGGTVPAVTMFARDFDTTARVWQHDSGYPGDPPYLEFHKKRGGGGLRYWRITDRRSDLAYKQFYVPEWAFAQTTIHAMQFVQLVRETLRTHWQRTRERGILVAAFDTELFGHWWFEGPQWVYEFLRQAARDPDIGLTTCGEYLRAHPPQRTVQLRESSWGAGGDHRVWLEDRTRPLWRNVYQAECDMQRLGAQLNGRKPDAYLGRILRQCGRELLLLQSSDWPFMISTGNTPDHARRRALLHFNNFQRARAMVQQHLAGEAITTEDARFLEATEHQDPPFPQLDYRVFWKGQHSAISTKQPTAPRSKTGKGGKTAS